MSYIRLGLFLILFSLLLNSKASHLVGGNFIVKQTSNNSFTVSLQIFRDCAGIALPSVVTVSIYSKSTNQFIQSIVLNRTQLRNIELRDNCYTPSLCIEEHFYTKANVILSDLVGGYYITYTDCCRNENIKNIINPGNTDMTYYVDIPNPALSGSNSSPVFSNYPANGYFCFNYHKFIDFSATDPDGDSLVYSLINPYASTTGVKPFPYVNWNPPFDLSNICGSHIIFGPMKIDSKTGKISGASEGPGIFLFSVLVEEYRNGKKIGEVHRDIQYESLQCTIDNIPEFNPNKTNIDVYLNTEGCFDIIAKDRNTEDTIYVSLLSNDLEVRKIFKTPQFDGSKYYYDNFSKTGDLFFDYFKQDSRLLKGVGILPMRFCITPKCEDLKDSFLLSLTSYSFGCSGSDTVQSTAQVNVLNSSPQLSINIPDSINATLGKKECFDVLLIDTVYNSDTLYIEGIGQDFDYIKHFVEPERLMIGDEINHFYSNFNNKDTLFFKGYRNTNGVIGGLENIPLRYCFVPDCSVKNENGKYNLAFKAYSNNCAIDTIDASATVEVEFGYLKDIPNVFTPNNDGINDYFEINNFRSGNWNFKVLNRWGKLVDENVDFNGKWDSKDAPSGLYYYTLHDSICNHSYKGWIQITR